MHQTAQPSCRTCSRALDDKGVARTENAESGFASHYRGKGNPFVPVGLI